MAPRFIRLFQHLTHPACRLALGLALGACSAPPPALDDDLSGSGDAPDLAAAAPDLASEGPAIDARSGGDLRPVADLSGPPPGDLGGSDLVKQRPYTAYVPPSYDPARPAPLLLMLHGYGSTAAGHEGYFQLKALADRMGFLYAYPDGLKDAVGQRFWEGTDACCNLFKAKIDDVAYLSAVLDDMMARYSVDRKRVFVLGHSNGGFMTHRLACDLAPRIAAVVSLAGHGWKDPAKCPASEPVAVLQIHGDKDATIKYQGGSNIILPPYPSAMDSIKGWAQRNGCADSADTTAPPVDVSASLPGAETTVTRYPGCRGGAAELWTIPGGPHQPMLAPGFQELIWKFLSSHPKP